MGIKEKLIRRLQTSPRDFSFEEAITLLGQLGYTLSNKGKTSGSRVVFMRKETKEKIILHKAHPDNRLRQYQVKQLLEVLREEGIL